MPSPWRARAGRLRAGLLAVTGAAALTLQLPLVAVPSPAAGGRAALHVPGYRMLPVEPGIAPPALSPDGRWLALSAGRERGEGRLVLYDLRERRSWSAGPGSDMVEPVMAWRPDSTALAASIGGGWAVLWPASRRVQWLVPARRDAKDEGAGRWWACAAWSPRTQQLAVFEDEFGDGSLRVWQGTRLALRHRWPDALKLPHPFGPWRAWECAWSPDERSLLFRFYGSAERGRGSTGHLVLIDPHTGNRRSSWGDESLSPRWLDGARLAYLRDTGGGMPPLPLVVADPFRGTRRILRRDVCAWMLSPGRGTLWAVTGRSLYWMRLADGRWRHICRLPGPLRGAWRGDDPSLALSPDASTIACVCEAPGKRGAYLLAAVDTTTGRVRCRSFGRGELSVAGWVRGRTLPMVAQEHPESGQWRVWDPVSDAN